MSGISAVVIAAVQPIYAFYATEKVALANHIIVKTRTNKVVHKMNYASPELSMKI